jgi:hypothetical protein
MSLARGLQTVVYRSLPESEMSSLPNVLILGIGNLLRADEGFGVRALPSFSIPVVSAAGKCHKME